MKASQHQVSPEEYILAPLSAQERLEAAFRIAQEAFKVKSLSLRRRECSAKSTQEALRRQAEDGSESSLIPGCWCRLLPLAVCREGLHDMWYRQRTFMYRRNS
jgi:hypothetical protein